MFKFRFSFVALIFLTACATPEEQMQAMEAKCAAFGFKAETDAFANCLLQQSQADDAQDFVRSQRAASQGYDMMMGQGAWATN